MKKLFFIFCFALLASHAFSQKGLAFFKKIDLNKDGVITQDELSTNKFSFSDIDKDKNGKITKLEAFKYFKKNKKKTTPPSFEIAQEQEYTTITQTEFCKLAFDYSNEFNGVSTLVLIDGKIVYENYSSEGGIDKPSFLASGTKSFCGVMAMIAHEEGLLDIDEKVSLTITEWQNDPKKSSITIRQLLSLTSGIKAGIKVKSKMPNYLASIQTPAVSKPGKKYMYGAEPFQIFGELMTRKLKDKGLTPLEYLNEKVFEPIGLTYDWWSVSNGNAHLPSGAVLTARNWALFGELIRKEGTWNGKQIISKEALADCFKGSEANPSYGLTWWLNAPVPENNSIYLLKKNLVGIYENPAIPKDLVIAAGKGKQRLYISKEKNIVIIRQANSLNSTEKDGSYFEDNIFLSLLFTGKKP